MASAGIGEGLPPARGPHRAARWTARAIRATRTIDRAWRLFDRLRGRLVVSLAPAAVLDCYNNLAYGRSDRYVLPAADAALLPWEAAVVSRFFPLPPARVLIGGAGGGREAFALARRGYHVVAFDPSAAMVASLTRQVTPDLVIEAFRGTFEALPVLEAATTDGPRVDLQQAPAFDGVLFGLSSFSHVRRDADRLRALEQAAALTRGPVAVSFFAEPAPSPIAPHHERRPPGFVGRVATRLLPVTRGDRFSMEIGYHHVFTRVELESLFARAGLRLVHLDLESNWCHAVLRRNSC